MKYSIVSILIGLSLNAFGAVYLKHVAPNLFIHQPKTDFHAIEMKDEQLKKKLVYKLFHMELIGHYGTKAYGGFTDVDFESYYEQFASKYWMIDMNLDGDPELIFNGYATPDDDMERFSIFTLVHNQMSNVYDGTGLLLAYKIHPNTKEIVLYHHQFPCCSSASHNLNRIRLVNGKIKTLQYYFVGREGDMVGPFFPKKVNFKSTYKRSEKGFHLFWSSAKVGSNAWMGRTDNNEITVFQSNTIYSLLAVKNKWKFVVVKSAPKLDKKNRVINPENFKSTFIFGWIPPDEN